MERGSQVVTLDQLDLIEVPPATATYIPVPHHGLATNLKTIAQDLLTDYSLVGENYVLARQGNQLFATLNFNRPTSAHDRYLSFCFRNSLDKSMAIGFCFGATAWICSNLMMQGDIVVMRKHTKGVWDALEDLAITNIYRSQKVHEQIMADTDAMRRLKITDNDAFKAMGVLYGEGVVSPRQLTVLRDEWLKPSYGEFAEEKNVHRFYMALTHAQKSNPPMARMEKAVQAHAMTMRNGVWEVC